MKINSIIVSTVDREPEYIHRTMASLALSLPEKKNIFLVVDGLSFKHYDFYSNYCKIYLNNPDPSMDNKLKRSAFNYARCLSLSRQLGGYNLIIEDDVLFKPRWIDKLNSINIKEESWLLSLNCLQNTSSDIGYGKFVIEDNQMPQPVWCRTYAVIYSPEILKSLPEMMLKIFLSQQTCSYDLTLGFIFLKMKTSIYECVPSVVDHIGEASCVRG